MLRLRALAFANGRQPCKGLILLLDKRIFWFFFLAVSIVIISIMGIVVRKFCDFLSLKILRYGRNTGAQACQ